MAFRTNHTGDSGMQNNKAVNEKLQSRLAIGMFVSQEISLAKAAQLAGQSISEFMDTLKGLGIPSVSYTEDMLLDDFKFANVEPRQRSYRKPV